MKKKNKRGAGAGHRAEQLHTAAAAAFRKDKKKQVGFKADFSTVR